MLVSASIWLIVVGAWLALLALFVIALAIANSRRKERRSGLDRRHGSTERRSGDDRRKTNLGAPHGRERRATSNRRTRLGDRRVGRDRRSVPLQPVSGAAG
jgi:hypothetical protein